MKSWILIVTIAVSSFTVIVLALLLGLRIIRSRRRWRLGLPPSETSVVRNHSLAIGISTLQQSYKEAGAKDGLCFPHLYSYHGHKADRSFHHVSHQEHHVFHWEDHRDLVSEAEQHGWSRFSFSGNYLVGSPLSRESSATQASTTISTGASSEFMQAVRLNPTGMATKRQRQRQYCSVWMDLPLPGPQLSEDTSFPRDSYFEITVLYLQSSSSSSSQTPATPVKFDTGVREGDVELHSEEEEGQLGESEGTPIHKKHGGEDYDDRGFVSLGLTRGGFPPNKKPGKYSGSISFNSDGSLYLQGKKLAGASEETRWLSVNSVIGCGFIPSKKKVIFTVDSRLLHVIDCGSDAFKRPLYPILAAANMDVMFLVNLGQKSFNYTPANSHRTPNPSLPSSSYRFCFHDDDATATAAATGHDQLAVGRMDANHRGDGEEFRSVHDDFDAESDLFEISINSTN